MTEVKESCIDKFIKKKVNRRICEILDKRLKIRLRKTRRFETIDYFNTECYEQDFSDIIELRNIAKQLSEDCNKFLERISEQYSKLN